MNIVIKRISSFERQIGTLSSLFVLALFACLTWGCSDDPDEPIGQDRSAVTSVTWTLVPEVGSIPVTISWEDLDFDGPGAPAKTSGTLDANTTYTAMISLTNKSVSPSINKNQEIQADQNLYQLFYQTPDNINVSYADQDGDSNPVGLQTSVTTEGPGAGMIFFSLRFALDKNAQGVAQGSAAQAGGAIDLQAELDFIVQ